MRDGTIRTKVALVGTPNLLPPRHLSSGVILMRPLPSNTAPYPGTKPLVATAAVLLLNLCLTGLGLTGLGLTGCAQFSRDAEYLTRQAREITCISRCQGVKEACDADARYDYQQCQAGYVTAQRNFRWCNADHAESCGYPWWSCSENLYGYCTNRYWECRRACQTTRY